MSKVRYHVGSTLLLLGAFAVGAVLHAVFVKQSFALTAPAGVFGIAGGLALVAVGRWLEGKHRESIVPTPEDGDGDGDDGGDEAEFDEEAAPFDAADLEKYERDEPS